MSTIKCPNCHCNLPEGASFCGNCGSKITICPLCEKALPSGSSFCNFCGFEINTDQNYDNSYTKDYDEFYDRDASSNYNQSYTQGYNPNYNQSYNQNYNQNYNTNQTSNQSFSSNSTAKSNQKSNTQTARMLFLGWEKESFFRKFLYTRNLWIVGFVATILYIVSYFVVKNSIEKVASSFIITDYEGTITTLKTILFTALSLSIVHRIYSDSKEILCFHTFSNWCSKHNFSLHSVVQNTFKLNFKSMDEFEVGGILEYVDLCACCEVYNKNTSFKIKIYFIKFIKIVVDIATSIVLVTLAYEVINLVMLSTISPEIAENSSIYKDYIENFLVVYILGARIIIDIICSISYKIIINREKKNWLNTNFHNYMEQYSEYKL